ncbi:hypothetical protein HYC85_006909 [Camellia sinensis]|uniref:Uncharacterized protein n=1 Tax=Camellia sinensis TaxID=4442 RepID=A0A7J7HMG5_CAMSI|nr:hypothetical protein HYC85_006909 [Camellia sinensis]
MALFKYIFIVISANDNGEGTVCPFMVLFTGCWKTNVLGLLSTCFLLVNMQYIVEKELKGQSNILGLVFCC